jgi:hypothetical protein
MVPRLRKAFNEAFTADQYQLFLKDLNSLHPGAIEFRVAETPVFADKAFTRKMLDTCESIIDLITDTAFKSITEKAIPQNEYVPGETPHSHMIAFDFGVCINDDNELEPQLIEMQGFPTLFGFQSYYPEVIRKHFSIPQNYSHYLNGYNQTSYLAMLKKLLLGNHDAENVVLLEIKPEVQKTRIDFYCTEDYTGIRSVCLTDVTAEGKKLFYLNNGKKTLIKRIYNRVIFDDLKSQQGLEHCIDLTKEWDVEWIPHPNWFYRISKFTLPYIRHPYVPKTYFLNEVKQIPSDLENYVLKPLFSFAGQGVIIDLQPSDLTAIKDPGNWILQRKVKYADAILTPDIPAKAEIRLMYVWPDGDARPHAAINLARLSKGKMIGVRYNKEKSWVGGSVCFFETY